MNARSTSFEFTCLGKKVNEISLAIFHSVIFNRCFGKFRYGLESSYSIGTLGFEEVICDFLDVTYIRVSSADLVRSINRDVKRFVDQLRTAADANLFSTSPSTPSYSSSPKSQALFDSHFRQHNPIGSVPSAGTTNDAELGFLTSAHTAATGTIMLEFQQKNPRTVWSFSEPLVWEVWSLKFNWLKDGANEEAFNKATIEEQLTDKMLSIVQIVNNSQYLPHMPSQSEVDNIFDTSYPDAQPYNFKISYRIGSGQTQSASSPRSGTDRNSAPHVIKNFIKQKLAL